MNNKGRSCGQLYHEVALVNVKIKIQITCLSCFPGFQEAVRQRPERVQASKDQEGPERTQAAPVGLLPFLTGKILLIFYNS